ncbi:MAG: hypothetical protein HOM34_02575 [Planctomycetes bacterium]|jgi:hypothetical protein|nr:hypothetical protein [Planctomycetota bacterium]MBT4029052.1 hypothetical protein [Planctomycetota bacterium]MBT4560328.1 hypothetical protein [Planctomycetota bacterium]MBT5101855.1 hypothetical protein [Planctomycetota bacterium]MBT5119589.1 hypothetical protein [Planctomycetota bacterium]
MRTHEISVDKHLRDGTWRLSVQLTIALILAALVVGWTAGFVVREVEMRQSHRQINADTRQAVELIRLAAMDAIVTEDRPVLQELADGLSTAFPHLHRFMIENEDGDLLASWRASRVANREQLGEHTAIVELSGEVFGRVHLVWNNSATLLAIQKHGLWLQVAVTMTQLLLSLVGLFWVQRLGIQPLHRITNRISSIADGEEEMHVKGRMAREFVILDEAVDDLVGAIQARRMRESQLRKALADNEDLRSELRDTHSPHSKSHINAAK